MLYRVDSTCTDFAGRYLEEGEIVEYPKGEKVPRHLTAMSEKEAVAAQTADNAPEDEKEYLSRVSVPGVPAPKGKGK